MSGSAHGNFSGKRLLILGCGYVGTAVAEQAIAAGATVTALTRNAGKAAALRAGGVQAVVADLASDAWHDAVAAAPDFAVNCVSGGGAGLDGYRHSYLRGMESVLRWAGRNGAVGTLVYTSSTSVYPQGGGAVVRERDSESGRDGESESESESERERESERGRESGEDRATILRATERLLRDSTGACDRWFILRLAGIYGPGRHHLVDQVRSGTVAGRGDHRLNLAHRDDIVAAILACCAAPPQRRNEVFNVADDGPTPKAEVVAWLAARLGVAVPQFSGLPAGARRALTPDRIIDNARLKSALGWTPRFPTFREGYSAMLPAHP